jgi:hypothetical protein
MSGSNRSKGQFKADFVSRDLADEAVWLNQPPVPKWELQGKQRKAFKVKTVCEAKPPPAHRKRSENPG